LIRTQAELDAYKLLGGVPTDIGIGDARFKDLNGDGKISLYGTLPVRTVTSSIWESRAAIYVRDESHRRVKRFDLGAFFQGSGSGPCSETGTTACPGVIGGGSRRCSTSTRHGMRIAQRSYPRLSHGDIRFWNYQPSSLQKINAAYLRLKNLQVGFTLPERLIAKARMTHARVYFSGFDLWRSTA